MDQDTIEGVVEGQVANPRVTDPDDPAYMPADLVRARTTPTSPPTSPASRASPASSPRSRPTPRRAPRSSSPRAAAAATRSPPPTRPAPWARTSTRRLPASPRPRSRSRSSIPRPQLAQGFGGGIMPDTYEDLAPHRAQGPRRLPRRSRRASSPSGSRVRVASASRSTTTWVIGRSISRRAFSTTPRSSQRERSGGWVEMITSSAANSRRRVLDGDVGVGVADHPARLEPGRLDRGHRGGAALVGVLVGLVGVGDPVLDLRGDRGGDDEDLAVAALAAVADLVEQRAPPDRLVGEHEHPVRLAVAGARPRPCAARRRARRATGAPPRARSAPRRGSRRSAAR